jgi:hypothetical protein
MSISAVREGVVPSAGSKFLKVMLLTGIPFGLFMGIFWSFLYGSKSAVVMGPIAGILFGVSMGVFVNYQKKKFETERPSFPGEDLVKEGGANHFRNIEAVGGWIYLTDQRLLFRSHSMNVQRHELTIPLGEISEAKPCMTFGIIPNGLEIKMIDGKTEKFVVEDRNDWAKKIQEPKERIAG